MSEERRISFDTYLRALALFMMASDHYRQSLKFRDSLEEILDVSDSGHVSDAIYENGPDRRMFDEALKLEGILVQPPESD
jgi:hypothetical protein